MIRKANERDRRDYIEMAREFYDSPAVAFRIPEEYFVKTFDEAMRSDVYVGLYIVTDGQTAAGYALTARSFSQEAGGEVVWIDELYIRSAYRSRGLGKEMLAFIEREFPAARYRLEIEPDNVRAKELYARLGYVTLPYAQMIKK